MGKLMAASLMINNNYSAFVQADMVTEVQHLGDQYHIDLSNPYDPKTKKFLAEQQAAMYFLVCAVRWLILQNAIAEAQKLKDKGAILQEWERHLESQQKKFMIDLMQQAELTKTNVKHQHEVIQELLIKQKLALEATIVRLENEKQILTETHEHLVQQAEVIVSAAELDWQVRHETAIDNAIQAYQEKSETFLRKSEDPEFKNKMSEYNQLKLDYENQLRVHQEKMNVILHKVSELRYQKNKIERTLYQLPKKEKKLQDLQDKMQDTTLDNTQHDELKASIKKLNKELKEDRNKITNLDVINQELILAVNEKDVLLKKEEIRLNSMFKELQQQAEYDEDQHIAKNVKGEIIKVNELREKMMETKSSIKGIVQTDVNDGLMHHLDESIRVEKTRGRVNTEAVIAGVAATTVGHTHCLAQLKFLKKEGMKMPSQIAASQKKGNALTTVQTNALNETQQEDVAATKDVIQVNRKVYKSAQRMDKVDREMLIVNQQLADVKARIIPEPQPTASDTERLEVKPHH